MAARWSSLPAMRHLRLRALSVLVVTLIAGTAAPSAVAAGGDDRTTPERAGGGVRRAVASAVAQATPAPAPDRKRSARRGAIRGALIGAGAGTALTIVAASAYGENEGGGFCVQCLVEWGAIVIPVSAGVGAGIGAIVGVALPNRQPGPWTPGPAPRRRAAAVGVSLRF